MSCDVSVAGAESSAGSGDTAVSEVIELVFLEGEVCCSSSVSVVFLEAGATRNFSELKGSSGLIDK